MYSGKSIGPRMEPWGTPALTEYSYGDFPFKTKWSSLLLRKEKIEPNIWPEIPEHLGLWRRPACKTLSKALDITSATARAILSDTNVRRSAFGQEDGKLNRKSEKRSISLDHQQSYCLQVFQRLY